MNIYMKQLSYTARNEKHMHVCPASGEVFCLQNVEEHPTGERKKWEHPWCEGMSEGVEEGAGDTEEIVP